MKLEKVGEVTHFYDKIGVAVVEISGELKKGDRVSLARGGEEMFEQEVESMQLDHNEIEIADRGASVGIKLSQPVRAQTELYKIVDEKEKK